MTEAQTRSIGEVLAGWDDVVQSSARTAKRARKVSRILAVSFVFDMLFTLGLGYGAEQRCQAANDFRRQDQSRWEYVLHLAQQPGRPESPQAKQFERYLRRADAPQVCAPW